MASTKRLQKEIANINTSSKCEKFSVDMVDDNLYEWNATLPGPNSTPYEGGIFHLKISIPQEYPFRPPGIRFVTPIFHPNINAQGEICLDILQDQWTPSLTIKSLLLSICSLLKDPNPEDPLMPSIAFLYRNDPEKFQETAKSYTLTHASG